MAGLRNLTHFYEDAQEEINIVIDRTRVADLGMRVNDIGQALQVALKGMVVSEFIDGDRQYDIRLRLPHHQATSMASTPVASDDTNLYVLPGSQQRK